MRTPSNIVGVRVQPNPLRNSSEEGYGRILFSTRPARESERPRADRLLEEALTSLEDLFLGQDLRAVHAENGEGGDERRRETDLKRALVDGAKPGYRFRFAFPEILRADDAREVVIVRLVQAWREPMVPESVGKPMVRVSANPVAPRTTW